MSLILGVPGSWRSKLTHEFMNAIKQINSSEDFLLHLKKSIRNKDLSNSDACLLAALYEANINGHDIDIIISRYDDRDESDKVKQADGILLSTPVYFGIASCIIEKFIKSYDIHDKIVAVTSVGAKRNGGQETTNIFTLYSSLQKGAYVIGNGPESSQFGGTAWAGDFGAVSEDNFGIETSLGIGKNMSNFIDVLSTPNVNSNNLNVLVLHDTTQEKIKSFINWLQYIHIKNSLNITYLTPSNYNINHCLACSICPPKYTKGKSYRCIQQDDFNLIHEEIVNSDIIINFDNIMDPYTYYKFMERWRWIRRDDFRIAYKPTFTFLSNYPESSSSIKNLIYFVRHNMITFPPINGYNDPYAFNKLNESFKQAIIIRESLKQFSRRTEYYPVGYNIF